MKNNHRKFGRCESFCYICECKRVVQHTHNKHNYNHTALKHLKSFYHRQSIQNYGTNYTNMGHAKHGMARL